MVRFAGGHTVAWSYSWLRESPVVKFIDLRYFCQCLGDTNGLQISRKVHCPGLLMPKLMCHTLSSLLYALLCWGLLLVKFNFMGGIWLESACKPSSLPVSAASNCRVFWSTEADSWKPELWAACLSFLMEALIILFMLDLWSLHSDERNVKLGDWRNRSVKGFATHSEGISYINLWNLLDIHVLPSSLV